MGERFGVICDDIHHTKLEVLLIQKKVLVLGMDIDELFTEFFQQSQLYRCIVDESATLASTRQFTADDTVGGIVFDIIIIKECLHSIA